MGLILGVIRYILVILVILIGTLSIVVVDLTNWRPHGIPAAQWVATYMTRSFNWIFNVRLTITDPDKLLNFEGFLVANHVSYLDIGSMLAAQPVRMLSAAEVRARPIIGRAGVGSGAIFVDRSSLQSRRDAIISIRDAYRERKNPPIVVFAEGRMGTGDRVFPFRLGTFKLAKIEEIPYLPVAIEYDRPDIVIWHGSEGETMVEAAWRLATFRGQIHAKMIPLDVVHPTPTDNAAHLANTAQADIAEALGLPIVEPRQAENSTKAS